MASHPAIPSRTYRCAAPPSRACFMPFLTLTSPKYAPALSAFPFPPPTARRNRGRAQHCGLHALSCAPAHRRHSVRLPAGRRVRRDGLLCAGTHSAACPAYTSTASPQSRPCEAPAHGRWTARLPASQGASLRGFWLVHFGRPPTGGYHRASLYVIATRFRSLNDLHLLAPLWNNAHEERQLKLAFRKLAQRDPDLAAEWERLTALAATTATQYDALLSALPAEPPI